MPMLDKPKHEKFAQGLAAGLTATKAYENAGYRKNRSSASRLAAKVNVRGRVAELRAETMKDARASITVSLATLTEMLLQDRDLAHRTKQSSAAVTATERLARLHGYRFDRTEKMAPPSELENRRHASAHDSVRIFNPEEIRRLYGGIGKRPSAC